MEYKTKYKIDSKNCLVIKRGRKSVQPKGRFAIDKDNRLIYWLNEPQAWRRQYNLPGKVTFKGDWQLDSDHNLKLKLNKAEDQREGDCIELNGEIISADNDELSFGIKSVDRYGQAHFQILKLSGAWGADGYNRIIFAARKKDEPDVLTLSSAWKINRNQQVAYTYEKTGLKTKSKRTQAITFSGFWQINKANRLTYIFTRSSLSRFDFRVQAESPNLYPQKGVIKYRIGLGAKEKAQSKERIICLYGTWKFSRKLGLSFNMDYGKAGARAISFSANVYLNEKDEAAFSLIDRRGEPLGLSVIYTHKFLEKNCAEVFLKIKKLEEEGRLDAGLRFSF